jgi:hypothetical protein
MGVGTKNGKIGRIFCEFSKEIAKFMTFPAPKPDFFAILARLPPKTASFIIFSTHTPSFQALARLFTRKATLFTLIFSPCVVSRESSISARSTPSTASPQILGKIHP